MSDAHHDESLSVIIRELSDNAAQSSTFSARKQKSYVYAFIKLDENDKQRPFDCELRAAQRFMANVVCHFGMPRSIVSDRDPKFTGQFWQELFRLLGIRLRKSTADLPRQAARRR